MGTEEKSRRKEEEKIEHKIVQRTKGQIFSAKSVKRKETYCNMANVIAGPALRHLLLNLTAE